jgi:hypothetical protein
MILDASAAHGLDPALSAIRYTQGDLLRMEFDPAVQADFVPLYGLLYHVENPIHVLRLPRHRALPAAPAFRAKHPNYRVGFLRDLDGKFDGGVCIEVIEHLPPPSTTTPRISCARCCRRRSAGSTSTRSMPRASPPA